MATLTVWRFDDPDGAATAGAVLERLVRDDALVLDDAAVVSWEPGQRRPRTHELAGTLATDRSDPLGPGFWGLLFGLVFFVPLLGAAMGAATGAMAGSLADVGIDDHFINRVRDQVTPGSSALFLLSSEEAVDRVREILTDGPRAELTSALLAADQEAALREVFGA